MDIGRITRTLRQGVDFLERFTPLTRELPGGRLVETGVKIAGALLETATNVQERVAEGTIVAGSIDQQQLQDILARIQKQNDELAEYIATH